MKLGRVMSLEANKKPVKSARASDGNIAVKISNDGSAVYGRHFDDQAQICSLLNRDSIDELKEFFKDEMTKDDWRTVIKLKSIFKIM